MRTFKSILLCFILIFLTNCSKDDDAQGPIVTENPVTIDYKEILEVSYGNDPDQVFDIFLPENRSLETKVLILVHGGSWVSGDKTDMNQFKNIIRQDLPNYAIVNMNYRLASDTIKPLPMQTDDISTVINNLKTNREEYIISEDYGFIGASAGSHLSLLWSYAYDTDSNINMVANIVGPTNFTDPAYLDNDEITILFGSDEESLKGASPFHQVNENSPPTILFYGGEDPLVPVSQAISLQEKLIEFNVINEYTLYPDEGHGWDDINLVFDTWNKIKIFTLEHL